MPAPIWLVALCQKSIVDLDSHRLTLLNEYYSYRDSFYEFTFYKHSDGNNNLLMYELEDE